MATGSDKPFGQDLDSALVLNAGLRKTFGEQNIYRIDHYLGKEMAQSIMVMRFANAFSNQFGIINILIMCKSASAKQMESELVVGIMNNQEF